MFNKQLAKTTMVTVEIVVQVRKGKLDGVYQFVQHGVRLVIVIYENHVVSQWQEIAPRPGRAELELPVTYARAQGGGEFVCRFNEAVAQEMIAVQYFACQVGQLNGSFTEAKPSLEPRYHFHKVLLDFAAVFPTTDTGSLQKLATDCYCLCGSEMTGHLYIYLVLTLSLE